MCRSRGQSRDEDEAPALPQDAGLAVDEGKPNFDCVWSAARKGYRLDTNRSCKAAMKPENSPAILNIRQADQKLLCVVEQV